MRLSIVAFDVPFPPNYGGAVDVFFRIKALAEAGVSIDLHCFDYGRGKQKALYEYCETVHYYKRKRGLGWLWQSAPYMAWSRVDNELIARLRLKEHILLEGTHTAGILPYLPVKKLFVRAHNVEADYYAGLAGAKGGLAKKLYFATEALLLAKKEAEWLKLAKGVFAISTTDQQKLKSLGVQHVDLLPPFHGLGGVRVPAGMGSYALYHGNLQVAENRDAVLWLAHEVFPINGMPLWVAGNGAGKEVRAALKKCLGGKLIEDPSRSELEHLIEGAHVHVLPTFQPTGLKLKLLHALFRGRHVVVNDAMIAGTGLESAVMLANSPSEWKEKLINGEFVLQPVSPHMIALRKQVLQPYSDAENAERLISRIWSQDR